MDNTEYEKQYEELIKQEDILALADSKSEYDNK